VRSCKGGKVNLTLEQTMKAKRVEERYSSTVSVASALDGVGGQRHTPSDLHPGRKLGTFFFFPASFAGGCASAEGRSGRIRTVPVSINYKEVLD
jgi:hypothetical protein